jgi:S-methylmethionine-dependent homocysteine/selenocysteine methylase
VEHVYEPSTMRLIDGGLSTQLSRLGAHFDDPLWTGRTLLDDPRLVEQAHRDYVNAGATAVIAASYQLSRRGFVESGLTVADADRALKEAVAVARRAVRDAHAGGGARAIVAASVGPFGAITHDGAEFRGHYGLTRNELTAFHRERLDVLVAAGPDLLAIETIPDLFEAQVLSGLLESYPSIPKWFSFTCADEMRLRAGPAIEVAVAAIAGTPGLVAVGVNCVEPTLVARLARRIRSVTDIPVIAYPNRGGPWDAAAGRWLGARTESFADWLPEWREAGVAIVGGCCGTDASDIAKLRDALADEQSERSRSAQIAPRAVQP